MTAEARRGRERGSRSDGPARALMYVNTRAVRSAMLAKVRWVEASSDGRGAARSRRRKAAAKGDPLAGHCHVRVFYLSTAPDVRRPTRAKSIVLHVRQSDRNCAKSAYTGRT